MVFLLLSHLFQFVFIFIKVEANPSLWLSTLSQYRVRDTFCSYGVIELCTKALSNSIQLLKQRNINLACVRTCVVVAEERPRVQLTQQFCKLFQALGLNTRCVSTSFGCRVNPAICVQGASSAESAQVSFLFNLGVFLRENSFFFISNRFTWICELCAIIVWR
jgi:hypothetical protein